MTTAIQGAYIAPTATNLTQTVNRAGFTAALTPIVLTTSPANFSRVYTLTLTISGTAYPSTISFDSSVATSIPFVRVSPTVVTVSSENIIAGVKVNNWAYFQLILKTLRVVTDNTVWVNPACSVSMSLTDGATTLTGTLTVSSNTAATPAAPVLSIYRATSTSNTISWAASTQAYGPGVNTYKVYKNGSLLTTVTSTLSYTDSAAGVGVHTYYVVGVDSSISPLSSANSNTVTGVASSLTAPVASLSRTANNTETLSWTASVSNWGFIIAGSWANTYKIYKDGSYLTTVTSVTSYVDSSAGQGVHTYYVIAEDSTGTPSVASANSNTVTGVVSSLTTPVASISRTGFNAASITWTAASSNYGSWSNSYIVYKNSFPLTTVTSATSYVDSVAGTGATSYYIIAEDTSATPAIYSVSSNTVNLVADTITTPATISSVMTSVGVVTVTWGASTANYPSPSILYELKSNGSIIYTGTNLSYVDSAINTSADTVYSVRAYESTVTSSSVTNTYPVLQKFVTTSTYGSYSTNATTWTSNAISGATFLSPVHNNTGWVATEPGYTLSTTWNSLDGIGWSSGSALPWAASWTLCTLPNVVVAKSGSSIAYSTNNTSWTTSGVSLPVSSNIGAGVNKFVVFPTASGSGTAYTSLDGNTWTTVSFTSTAGGTFSTPVNDGANGWVCVASNRKVMSSSNNGATWAESSYPGTANVPNGALFTNLSYTNGTWCAVGTYNGYLCVIKSTNGTTWSANEIPGDAYYSAGFQNAHGNIIYFNSKYITLCDFGTVVYYSTDLTSWSSTNTGLTGSSSQNTNIINVNAGNTKLVASRWNSGSTNRVAWSSTNGTTWSSNTLPGLGAGTEIKFG